MNRTTRRLWTAAAACLIAAAVGTPHTLAREDRPMTANAAQLEGPAIPTVTAQGTATISRAPDQAVVNLGATTVGKTSTEAQDKLNKSLERIVAAVKALQLPGLKVQTQWLSLNPVYERIDYREQQREGEAREPRIIGYTASNTVSVTVADVTKAGAIIDAAIEAGANHVSGISFQLKDDKAVKAEALRAAARDARAKAESMADALDLRVVRIIEVHSGFQARPMPVYRGMKAATAMESADAMAPTVVEPGEVSITEQVTVTVEVAAR